MIKVYNKNKLVLIAYWADFITYLPLYALVFLFFNLFIIVEALALRANAAFRAEGYVLTIPVTKSVTSTACAVGDEANIFCLVANETLLLDLACSCSLSK
jgi:hypothetical protein